MARPSVRPVTNNAYQSLISAISQKLQRAAAALMVPVEASSLATFRILFGLLLVYEVYRYFKFDRITRYYVEPHFYFYYEFFPFISPLPGPLMYWVFFAMGIFALGIALGFFYRVSAFLFFLTYTYVFLLDKAQYNNHYYLIILLAFLLIFVDADRWAAADRWVNPNLDTGVVPFWNLFILRAQIVIVYFYAGVAKLNADWLAGEPIRTWLHSRADYPVVGPFFLTEAATYFFGYGGLLFDLSIGFLLLWKRTRLVAFFGLLFFHLMNKWLFSIGIFPYLMIAATILFVEPDWPRRVLALAKPNESALTPGPMTKYRPLILSFVAVYLAIQILVPLRHFLYPGEVAWTEEGHRFSWHMKLRSKNGYVDFTVTDPQTHQTRAIDMSQDLTQRQIGKMAGRPDMILQYAHYLQEKVERTGIENPVIQVEAWASLNYRPYQRLIDPHLNLADVRNYPLRYSTVWILPLEETALAQENFAGSDDFSE